MDGNCRHSGALRDLCDLDCIDAGIVKTFAEFHRHRLFYSFYKLCEDLLHQFRILHER